MADDSKTDEAAIRFAHQFCTVWVLGDFTKPGMGRFNIPVPRKLTDLDPQLIVDEWRAIQAGTSTTWFQKPDKPEFKAAQAEARGALQALLEKVDAMPVKAPEVFDADRKAIDRHGREVTLGPTEPEVPDGEGGELIFGVRADQERNLVILAFGAKVSELGFDPHHALGMAHLIIGKTMELVE